MKKILLALALVTLSACASVDRFNAASADITSQAITASEQHRCTVHAQPCLSDTDFQRVNVSLNKISVAGREFTKIRLAGKASTTDVSTFLGVVAEETSILAKAFPNGALGTVFAKLLQLQAAAVKLLG